MHTRGFSVAVLAVSWSVVSAQVDLSHFSRSGSFVDGLRTSNSSADRCSLDVELYGWPWWDDSGEHPEEMPPTARCCHSEPSSPGPSRPLPTDAEKMLSEVASYFDYLPAQDVELRCCIWRDAIEASVYSGGDPGLDALGVAVLEVSASRTLVKANALLAVLVDWSCGNAFAADLALLQLLEAWHDLCGWQLSRWGGINIRWREVFVYSIQLVGVAAARLEAKGIMEAQDFGSVGIEETPPALGQQDLDATWRNMYVGFKRIASLAGWWARVVEDRWDVAGWRD